MINIKLINIFCIIVFLSLGFESSNSEETKLVDLPELDFNGLVLKSNAFNEGEFIPKEFTCDGADVSPDLTWKSALENVVTYALVCDDPDAPGKTWVHWIAFNLPDRLIH